MTLPLICTTDIDWSWLAEVATCVGAISAVFAMYTWKKQIRLQDRYQKADALLKSFIMCFRAGHDWQRDCGFGEARNPPENSEKYPIWRNALMDYRLEWTLAHPLFDKNKDRGLRVHPETLQSAIISAGNHPTYNDFYEKICKLEDDGAGEIINRRDLGLPK